ncbi:hypothetical protein SP15_193 [Bacillus phage SP-15]|uniref:Uncharacterized protein n=1 Tax=Bacillus phage SP-15 TaxID=1792032 RepID=A0A127AWM9_9CAUD|nr:hypothetical protein SP15_193 [Bacillus phage SP-15]AMM44993.1 hypothetical protein SP15_193 [Bacillus phage SP-15]
MPNTFYYMINEGEFEDYDQVTLGHEKEFTAVEFAEIYNKALSLMKSREQFININSLVETLVESFGFHSTNPVVNIFTTYNGKYVEVDTSKVTIPSIIVDNCKKE